MSGLIYNFTGSGKGKTSAALGLAVKALGAGLKVAWFAFDKCGENTFDFNILSLYGLDPFIFGERRTFKNGNFRTTVTRQDKEAGEAALALIRIIFNAESYDMVVLDEVNVASSRKIIKESDVLNLLARKPQDVELIMTGRDAPESFLARADVVTIMEDIKNN